MAQPKQPFPKRIRSWVNLSALEKEYVVRLVADGFADSESQYFRQGKLPLTRADLVREVNKLRRKQKGARDPLGPLAA